MNSKDKMLELLANKLKRRALELDRDAARLNLVNRNVASNDVRNAVRLLQLAIENLEG